MNFWKDEDGALYEQRVKPTPDSVQIAELEYQQGMAARAEQAALAVEAFRAEADTEQLEAAQAVYDELTASEIHPLPITALALAKLIYPNFEV